MSPPRLLLLVKTSSYRASAFLDAAATLNLAVTVGSERPQALALHNPAGHLTLPFGDLEAATQATLAFAKEFSLAAVVAADDHGVLLEATANQALGLPGNDPDAVARALDKHASRLAFRGAGLPSPGFRRVSLLEDPENLAPKLKYPCVLKPLSLSASRGVIRADDPEAFVQAAGGLKAILEGSAEGFLVEDYLPGVEIAVEGLLQDGEFHVLALFDKPDTPEGPYFEETMLITPSRLPKEAQANILKTTQRGIEALGLGHGPIHAELRVNDGGAYLLEIAPRSIGGLCSKSLRFFSGQRSAISSQHQDSQAAFGSGDKGLSLEALILLNALGEAVSIYSRERQASGVMMMPIPKGGILEGVEGLERARAVPFVEEVRVTIPLGQEVVPLPEGSRYLGFIFARAEGPAEVEEVLRRAYGQLTFTIA
jgi:phosphoribosylaminoimidazole carboxylase (NCAIR synthetase)